MNLEDFIGSTEFLYGYRCDWDDALDIVADEHNMSETRIAELRKMGKLLSEDEPIRQTDNANYSLMILTQMMHEGEPEPVEGDYLFLSINQMAKKSKILTVKAWISLEHKDHPELTMYCFGECFRHLTTLKNKFPNEIRKVRTVLGESNWFLAQGLSRMGFSVKARKLRRPVLSSDGKHDFHEYIVEF